jgi:Short C-terminal domain
MGLFLRPRRPLMRLAAGAATAGVAYHAGRRRAEQDEANEQAQAVYQATQAAPAPLPAAPAAGVDATGELERLAKLHASGSLSDAEFSAAKSRLLGV